MNDFISICHIFDLSLTLLNSVTQTLKILKIYLTFLHLIGFIEKNKVPFNSVKILVVKRHLYLDFESNEREEVKSACDFVSGVLFEDNSNRA